MFSPPFFSLQGCNAAFTSIMGYVYHMKKCGKEESELEKMLLSCSHCGKTYKSKAGLEYHLKSEHAPVSYIAHSSVQQDPTGSDVCICIYLHLPLTHRHPRRARRTRL